MNAAGGGGAMRVEVYKGGELAAVLEYGRAPAYRGHWGGQARYLLERPHYARHPGTGAVVKGPRADTPAWWLASIRGAGLEQRGFTVREVALPHPAACLTGSAPDDRAGGW